MASKKENAQVPAKRFNQTSVQSKTGVVAVYPTATPGSRADAIEKARERDRLEKLNAKTHITTLYRRADFQRLMRDLPGSETDTQVSRLLSALEGGPVTTHEARLYLDVLHPPGRVMTLRDQGCEIDMKWVVQLSSCGKPHRVGRYTLLRKVPS